jgi:hypothetical protein
MTKNTLLLAAAVALLVPQLAVAGSVTYTTSGKFSSSGSATSSILPVTFNPTSQTIATPDATALFGTFSLGKFAKCKKGHVCTTSDDLTLKISQSGGGSGNLSATVTGIVAFNSSTGALTWTFSSATVTINGVTYVGYPGNSGAGLKILGLVSGTPSVPEPNAQLLLGLGTMGLMGIAFLSRKVTNA